MRCTYNTINLAPVKRDPIIGNNIYDNISYRNLQNYLNKLICNNTILSHYPLVTGVIPNFYNQLQAVDRRNTYYKQQYLNKIRRRDIEIEEEKEADKIVEGFGDNISISHILIIVAGFLMILFYVTTI